MQADNDFVTRTATLSYTELLYECDQHGTAALHSCTEQHVCHVNGEERLKDQLQEPLQKHVTNCQ